MFLGADQFFYRKTGDQYKNYYTKIGDSNSGLDFEVPILLSGPDKNRDTTYYIPNSDPTLPPVYKVMLSTIAYYADVTVNGKQYNNCIITGITLFKRFGNDNPANANDYYVDLDYTYALAPNIGIVEEVVSNGIVDNNSYPKISLTSYDIK